MKIRGKLSVSDGDPFPGDTRLFVSKSFFDDLVRITSTNQDHANGNPTVRNGKYDRSFQWDFVIGEEITREVFLMILKNVGLRPSPTVTKECKSVLI